MASILIVYSSTDGHTLKICQRLKEVIEQQSHRVTPASIQDHPGLDLRSFDKIVIGASIRYGRHNPSVAEFIRRNQPILESKPNAFFSVNLVARKPEKSQPNSNPYLRQFLKRISWKPRELAVFAGKIDYPSYGFFDRMVIRLIMWITKGPTNPNDVIEFTDWRQVEAFGRIIATM